MRKPGSTLPEAVKQRILPAFAFNDTRAMTCAELDAGEVGDRLTTADRRHCVQRANETTKGLDMLDLGGLDLMLSALIADLDALDVRLRDREAMADPQVLTEAARVVRAVIGALGTSQTRLAAIVGVAGEKTVRDWCSARMAPTRTALRVMRLLLERLVDPPPEALIFAQDRFGPCAAAVGPHLDQVAERAETAGWTEREAAAAVRSWLAGRGG
jgi:DNA-binding transcriptional regulator YiaG